MSFILDALRKSEHARQHHKGPALAEVPIAAAKPRTNLWATAAVGLLVVNLVAVGVLMLRRAQRSDNSAESAAMTAPAANQQSAMSRPGAGADRTRRRQRRRPRRQPQAWLCRQTRSWR